MWVIKLGGGLAQDPILDEWLAQLTTLGGGRAVVVPGRGCSAGFVRELQLQWQFDDLVAHNMLVLARAQYGLLMGGLAPALAPAIGAADIRGILQRGGVALWMPLSLMREQADEMAVPDMTSDCIAAWLAAHLNAERLILVKSRPINTEASIAQHIRDGVLDQRFARYARIAACPVDVLHKSEPQRLQSLLLNGAAI